MRRRKLGSIYWQRALKQNGVKQGLSLFFPGPNIVMWIPILSTKVCASSRCTLPALISRHIRPYYQDKIDRTQTYSRGDKSQVTVFVWRR